MLGNSLVFDGVDVDRFRIGIADGVAGVADGGEVSVGGWGTHGSQRFVGGFGVVC